MTQMPEGGNPEVLGNTIFDYLHACNTQLNTMPLGEERDVDGKAMFGVASQGEFFAMAEASAVREFA